MPIFLQLIADNEKYKDRKNRKKMLLCIVLLAKGCNLFLRSFKQNHDHGLRGHECRATVARVAKSFLTVIVFGIFPQFGRVRKHPIKDIWHGSIY